MEFEPKYKEVFYFTLEEVINLGIDYHEQNDYPWNLEHTFSRCFAGLFPNAPLWTSSTPKQSLPHIEDVWNLIFSRYLKHYCFEYPQEWSNQISGKFQLALKDTIFLKIVNLMVMTYPKYSKILDLYASKENALLDSVKSGNTGSVRFNDTPQEGGDFSDDEHTTNITQTEAENYTDGATPIERLDEIKRKYASTLREWSDKFNDLFIEEGNI